MLVRGPDEGGREMAPVQRRQSKSEQHMKYEAYRPLTVREMTSLNAVEEAMMMRLRRHAITVVTATESRGIELRGSTCWLKSQNVSKKQKVGESGQGTLLSCFQNGSPWSRANDHVIREEDATKPMVAHTPSAVIIAAIAVLPVTEFVDWRNISIKGYPVGVWIASSMSPRQSRTAISMPNPRKAFSVMLVTMERGTLMEGFCISSDI